MLLICLKIYAARILDVSLGTLRTIFFVKGKTIEPFLIAFFEVLIWFLVAREALNTEGNIYLIAVSYAGGYATGTYIGTLLSKVLIKGVAGVQVVVSEPVDVIINKLREKDYSVSVIDLKDTYDGNPKDMLYIQVNNSKLKELTNIIKRYDKNAFIAVNETKYVSNGFIK